jgi:hypothetical protein
MAPDRISVRSPGGPRRRGGIAFGPVAVELLLDALTEDQAAAIAADPMLEIAEIPAS